MKSSSISRFLFLVLLTVFTISVYSQNTDFKNWVSVDLKKNLNKWDFTAEVELREDSFFRQMERLSLQLEGMYEISKIFSTGVSYMVMDFYDEKYNDHQLRHRFQLIASAKADAGRFGFSLREKGEITAKDESDRIDSDGEVDTYRINPDYTWRNRIKVEYDVEGIALIPFISLETFYLLNDPDGNRFEKLRYTLGLEYDLNKHNRINLFGHFNKELLDGEPDSYVAGLGYTHIF